MNVNDSGCQGVINYNCQKSFVIVSITPGATITDAIFDAHLKCFEQVLKQGNPFHYVIDTRGCSMISPKLIYKQTVFLKSMDAFVKQNLLSSVFIINNYVVREAINLLFMLKTPVKPNTCCETMEEALHWCGQHKP